MPALLGLRVLMALWFPSSAFPVTTLRDLVNGLKRYQEKWHLTNSEMGQLFSLARVLDGLKTHMPHGHTSSVQVLHVVLDEVHELTKMPMPKSTAKEEPLLAAVHRALLEAASKCFSCVVIPTYAATLIDDNQLALQSSGFGRPTHLHLKPLSLQAIEQIATPPGLSPDFWQPATMQMLLQSLGGNARAARYLRSILEKSHTKPLDDIWNALADRISDKFSAVAAWIDPLLALLAFAGIPVPESLASLVERVQEGGVTDVVTIACKRFLSCPLIILFATFRHMNEGTRSTGGARPLLPPTGAVVLTESHRLQTRGRGGC